ncbi:MAG: DUF3391 domain-containing protein, partial [Comamonadaceae bacterium]
MNSSILIDIGQLRVGMYIQLDVGWLHHPFPVSSFRVASAEQIATLRDLGLTEVRYVPKKSDPDQRELVPAAWRVPAMDVPSVNGLEAASSAAAADSEAQRRRELLEAQHRALALCDQRFGEATRAYQALERAATEHPDDARAKGDALVSGCVTEFLEHGDSVIRLLSEGVGERNALHPVNVMVIALLLGRALGVKGDELHGLGVAAPGQNGGPDGQPAEAPQHQKRDGCCVHRIPLHGLFDVLVGLAGHLALDLVELGAGGGGARGFLDLLELGAHAGALHLGGDVGLGLE